jgi:hypothetical protein
MRETYRLINWILNKNNYPYLIFLAIGIIIGSYKYSFTGALIGFLIIIAIGLIAGFIINKLLR